MPATSSAAWLTSIAVTRWLPQPLQAPFHTHLTIVLGTSTIFLVGLFVSLLFLFIRLLPALSMSELRMIVPEGKKVEHK